MNHTPFHSFSSRFPRPLSALILLVILFLAISSPAMAFQADSVQSTASAQPEIRENVLKINTLSLLLGTGSIFYERRLQENLSAQLGTAFLRYDFDGTTFSGLILTPELRYYPRDNAMSGVYMAPYLRLQRFMLKNDGDKGVYRNLGGGLLVGRQWITRSDFTMDLFFGGHYGRGTIKVDNGDDDDDFDTEVFEGFRPRVGFAIGFAF